MNVRPILVTLGLCSLYLSSCGDGAPNISWVLTHGVTRSSIYESDDKWWACRVQTPIECYSGSLEQLGLSKAEQDFVTNVLDRIPRLPNRTTLAQVAEIVGTPDYKLYGTLQKFYGRGISTNPEQFVSAYFNADGVFMVQWYEPNRPALFIRRTPD